MQIRLLLDEDIHGTLAQAVCKRGFDKTSSMLLFGILSLFMPIYLVLAYLFNGYSIHYQ